MWTLIGTLAVAMSLAFVPAGAALAGGDDITSGGDFDEEGPAYFGFVRDHRGMPVSEAVVKLIAKSGKTIEAKTNVLGLYRAHVSKDVVAQDVEVACGKAGFRQTKVFRRTTDVNARAVETDCTLQRL